MSRQNKQKTKNEIQNYVATLRNVQKEESLYVYLNIEEAYWKRDFEAKLIAFTDKELKLKKVTFITDRLHWPYLMKTIARRDKLVETIKEQIENQSDYAASIKTSTLFTDNKDLEQRVLNAIQENSDWVKILDDGLETWAKNQPQQSAQKWLQHIHGIIKKLKDQGKLPNEKVLYDNYDNKKKKKLRYKHWSELTAKPEVEYQKKYIEEAYENNIENFVQIIDEVANAFVDSYIKNYRGVCEFPNEEEDRFVDFRNKLLDLSFKYIKGKSAIILFLMKEGDADAMTYPFCQYVTDNEFYGLIKKLCFKIQKSQMENDKRIMQLVDVVFTELSQQSTAAHPTFLSEIETDIFWVLSDCAENVRKMMCALLTFSNSNSKVNISNILLKMSELNVMLWQNIRKTIPCDEQNERSTSSSGLSLFQDTPINTVDVLEQPFQKEIFSDSQYSQTLQTLFKRSQPENFEGKTTREQLDTLIEISESLQEVLIGSTSGNKDEQHEEVSHSLSSNLAHGLFANNSADGEVVDENDNSRVGSISGQLGSVGRPWST